MWMTKRASKKSFAVVSFLKLESEDVAQSFLVQFQNEPVAHDVVLVSEQRQFRESLGSPVALVVLVLNLLGGPTRGVQLSIGGIVLLKG